MRSFPSRAFLVAVLFLGATAMPCMGQDSGPAAGSGLDDGLDLMDLELPGQGTGDQMELPPIEPSTEEEASKQGGTAQPAPGTGPVAHEVPARGPSTPGSASSAKVESSTAVQPAAASPAEPARAPLSDMVPLLLGDTGTGWEVHKKEGAGAGRPAAGKAPGQVPEVPLELKPLRAPPPSRPALKAPSGPGEAASAKSEAPEVPLLTGEAKGMQPLRPTGRGSSLAIKPLSDLYQGEQNKRMAQGGSNAPLRPQDYLQIRDEIDPRLIEIYERFYKNR